MQLSLDGYEVKGSFRENSAVLGTFRGVSLIVGALRLFMLPYYAAHDATLLFDKVFKTKLCQNFRCHTDAPENEKIIFFGTLAVTAAGLYGMYNVPDVVKRELGAKNEGFNWGVEAVANTVGLGGYQTPQVVFKNAEDYINSRIEAYKDQAKKYEEDEDCKKIWSRFISEIGAIKTEALISGLSDEFAKMALDKVFYAKEADLFKQLKETISKNIDASVKFKTSECSNKGKWQGLVNDSRKYQTQERAA